MSESYMSYSHMLFHKNRQWIASKGKEYFILLFLKIKALDCI